MLKEPFVIRNPNAFISLIKNLATLGKPKGPEAMIPQAN